MRIGVVLLLLLAVMRAGAAQPRELWLVMGAAGEESFAVDFAAQAAIWRSEAERAGDVGVREIRSRDALQAACQSAGVRELVEHWVILIGHGTFDGRTAKFNLEGPDVSAEELATWTAAWTHPLVVIHTGECSGPFLPALSAKNRVILTATQSGSEVVMTRFGAFLAEALRDPKADQNRDGAISLLEAFLVGSGRTTQFYEQERRLASEHALIDDNGDGKGTRADWFEGGRVVRKDAEGKDPDGSWARKIHLVPGPADQGLTAAQRARRDELEEEVQELRGRRAELGEGAWFDELEKRFLELGVLLGSQPES